MLAMMMVVVMMMAVMLVSTCIRALMSMPMTASGSLRGISLKRLIPDGVQSGRNGVCGSIALLDSLPWRMYVFSGATLQLFQTVSDHRSHSLEVTTDEPGNVVSSARRNSLTPSVMASHPS